jgi:acetyl-CoA C-acetyltransferase/acetyl-CoA acyltransferase
MPFFRKKIFASAGYNTLYFGSGRPEFDPRKAMPNMEHYLLNSAAGTLAQVANPMFDEGVIASFMSARFLKQANLPGFLPMMVPQLAARPCFAVEGACGSGGRAIGVAARSVLSDCASAIFVAGFEVQNGVKAVYGADILAGAAHYSRERQAGHAYFFPGLFSERARAYGERYDQSLMRRSMAAWYEQAILNARLNPKAQEYHNSSKDLLGLGMTAPDSRHFVPHLNHYDCSKVSDGASSIVIGSEEGMVRCAIPQELWVEIVAIGEAQGDITLPPDDLTTLSITAKAAALALERAEISLADIGLIELHDCFSITALEAIEAIGLAAPGRAPDYILEGHTRREGCLPINVSGGLVGFGHPTGATGIRQLVDLQLQLTGQADGQIALNKHYGMLISMGGNDKTVTCCIVKRHR